MSDWEPRESIHALRGLAGAQVEKIMDPTGHKMVRIFLEALGPAEYAARQRPGTLDNAVEVSLTPDEAIRIGQGLLDAGREALGSTH